MSKHIPLDDRVDLFVVGTDDDLDQLFKAHPGVYFDSDGGDDGQLTYRILDISLPDARKYGSFFSDYEIRNRIDGTVAETKYENKKQG